MKPFEIGNMKIPPKRTGRASREPKYPFDALKKPDQCFYVPKKAKNALNAALNRRRAKGESFTIRTIGDRIYVWRA